MLKVLYSLVRVFLRRKRKINQWVSAFFVLPHYQRVIFPSFSIISFTTFASLSDKTDFDAVLLLATILTQFSSKFLWIFYAFGSLTQTRSQNKFANQQKYLSWTFYCSFNFLRKCLLFFWDFLCSLSESFSYCQNDRCRIRKNIKQNPSEDLRITDRLFFLLSILSQS